MAAMLSYGLALDNASHEVQLVSAIGWSAIAVFCVGLFVYDRKSKKK